MYLVHNVTTATDVVVNTCNRTAWASERQQFSFVLAFAFGLPATVIVIVTIFGNLLVLCFKARVGKRQTTLLVWNLGLADFMVGLFVLPLGVGYVIGRRWPFGRLMCRIWACCDVVFCTASIVTLSIISVDRYIGVTRPLRYKAIVTKKKVTVANVAIWLFSVSILLACVKYDQDECQNPDVCSVAHELEYVVHSVVIAFFMPAFITLFLYWKVYSVARKREKGLSQGLAMVINDNFLRDCVGVPLRIHCGNNDMAKQQQLIKMHKKVAKTLGVVVSAFLLCWLPFFSLYLIGYQCNDCIPSLVLDITTWLGYCNSCLNPLIYAYTIDEFRESLKHAFSTFAHCRSMTMGDGDHFVDHSNEKPLRRCKKAYSTIPANNVVAPDNDDQSSKSKRDSQASIRTFTVAVANGCTVGTVKKYETQRILWSGKAYCTLIDPKSTGL